MNNTIIIFVIIVIIGALAYMVFQQYFSATLMPSAPAVGIQKPQQDQTSPAAIQEDLQAIDIGDLDKDFKSIDADLNAL